MLPVGLFGFAKNTILVAGETEAKIASASAVSRRSGVSTIRHPA
jgi:hypothetical protein